MNIRPGLNINIIVNIDHMRETVDVGNSIIHEMICPFNINEPVTLALSVEESPYEAKAKVLRVWEPENERLRKLVALASAQFIDMDAGLKNSLARKVRDVERDLRYKEVHPRR